MNGSTDVRSTSSTGSTPRSATGAKTDKQIPITSPVPDSAGKPRSSRGGAGGRIISGLDLIDCGAGGLMPNHVYLVNGAGGLGKSILGLQFLTRGREHQEPGILITAQKPEKVITQATAIGFTIEDAVRRNQLSILNPSGRYFDLVEIPADEIGRAHV